MSKDIIEKFTQFNVSVSNLTDLRSNMDWTVRTNKKNISNRDSHIGVQLSLKLTHITNVTLEELTFVWLTLIVKSWKTHREFFLKLSISGSWARPFTWKTLPLKIDEYLFSFFQKFKKIELFIIFNVWVFQFKGLAHYPEIYLRVKHVKWVTLMCINYDQMECFNMELPIGTPYR